MPNFNDILEKSKFQPPLLYGISCRHGFPSLRVERYLELMFRTSAHIIQWREKGLSPESNRQLVRRGVELSRATGKLFVLNSLVQIALKEGSTGAHLTSNQNLKEALTIVVQSNPTEFMLGKSVHSLSEAKVAQLQEADYVLLSPILDPLSKVSTGSALGLRGLKEAVETLKVPVFALGGLQNSNIKEISQVGAIGMAGISWMQREIEQLL